MSAPSKLEAILLNVGCVHKDSEYDIDLLRQLLVGEIGTQDQRAAVTRILSQIRPKKLHHTKIARVLMLNSNESPKGRTTYADRGIAISDLI